MRKIIIAVLFVLAFPANAQSLCATGSPSASEAPELQMTEATFTEKAALESLNWLENDFWVVLKRHKTTNELLMNTEGFGIPYPNSVKIAKGTLLRLRALLMQSRLDNERLKLTARLGSAKEVRAAQAQFTAARREFCGFMRNAKYVD